MNKNWKIVYLRYGNQLTEMTVENCQYHEIVYRAQMQDSSFTDSYIISVEAIPQKY